MTSRQVLETVIGEHDRGRRVVLCAVVATRGSTPQPAGVMVCVDEDARLVGTLGGGCVEADVRRLAHQQLSMSHGRLTTFALDADFGYDDGMICGGQMDIAIVPIAPTDNIDAYRTATTALSSTHTSIKIYVTDDGHTLEYRIRIEPTPTLFIAGAGHISRVLAKLTQALGFTVHVIDDRHDYVNNRRFSPQVHTHVGNIAETLKQQHIDASSYIVIVTRGHKHDETALEAALGMPAKYIGMIGSRRKIAVIFDDLRRRDYSDAALNRVHAPIGLAIGAVSAEEIAVSIAAELIQVRRADDRKIVDGPIPVERPVP